MLVLSAFISWEPVAFTLPCDSWSTALAKVVSTPGTVVPSMLSTPGGAALSKLSKHENAVLSML